MNRHKHDALWLMLPALLAVLYFVVFQPRPDSTTATITPVDIAESRAVEVSEPVAPPPTEAGLVRADIKEPLVEADDDDEASEKVALDREYINYAFPVLSSWNIRDIKPLLADETVAASSDAELDEVMSVLEDRLGNLKYFDTPEPVLKPQSEESSLSKDGLRLYQFMAYYEAGVAEVNLMLQQERNANSLYSFNINVPD